MSGCVSQPVAPDRHELAMVNGEPITLDYLQMTFTSRHGDLLILLQEEGALEKYLEKAINLKLLAQEAYRLGLDQEPEIRGKVEETRLELAKEKLLADELDPVTNPMDRREKRNELVSDLRAAANIEIQEDLLSRLVSGRTAEGDMLQAVPDSEILAVAGGEKITAGMLKRQLRVELLKSLPREEALKMVRMRLDRMIDDLLLKQEAVSRGYATRTDVERELHIAEEHFLRNRLYQEVVMSKAKITEQDLSRYYHDHPDEFTIPERGRFSHILLESREEAEDVLSALDNGASFERLALDRSADRTTAERLGQIGWITKGRFEPDFEKAAFALEVGETSDIVETKFGFHIIRRDAKREAELRDFSAARNSAFQKIAEQKQRELIDYWIQTLRKRSTIEVYRDRIESLQTSIMKGRVQGEEKASAKGY